MHPLVKRLLDMNAYQPVSTAQSLFLDYDNTFTEQKHTTKSELVSKSTFYLSKGLVKIGIMPRTGTTVLYKSIKQE